jgi:SpoVK/Ycf46/Vps4 family AAA+-type ATPase
MILPNSRFNERESDVKDILLILLCLTTILPVSRPAVTAASTEKPPSEKSDASQEQRQLSESQRLILRDIVTAARENHGTKKVKHPGIKVLFNGPCGSGKTMAAESLARELGTDLYRVDLSKIISKYIGETEKNLRRVFETAEARHSILFFDEADALFGKRSEVKDSHDRFANIEVNYLLQRMEDYDGVAILATSHKDNIDQAFLRRIRFLVDVCN